MASSLLDNHLNESSLAENEGINTHHTADLLEHNSLTKRFCQWNDEFIDSTLPHLDLFDKKSKNNRQNYNFILDEEIQFIEELTISNINKFLKQRNEVSTQEFKDKIHDSLQIVRKTLPIYQFRASLMEAIRDYQVLIIQGEAGSGKTTQLTQYLYEEGYCQIDINKDEEIKSSDAKPQTKKKMMIACIQSHSIAAISAAARVAEEMNVKLGNEVGYSIRFQDCSSDRTIIKYMTDEMLLKEFLIDSNLASYSVLIIDETYKDILFGLVKYIRHFRPELKLLISTATLEGEKFSQFFDDAPIFILPGRRFPVDIYYMKASEADYINVAVETVLEIHTTQPFGDILVFFASQEEIEMAIEMLRERIEKLVSNDKQLIILSIYPTLFIDISGPTQPNERKVFLSTNIAQASLITNGIHYVIDSGFSKQKVYDSRIGMESLMITPISKVLANQRAGRAGFIAHGKCFRLYTAWTYQHELNDKTIPEIQQTNLCDLILSLKSLGIDNPSTFYYINPPPLNTFDLALEKLYALGALNDKNELTNLGHRMVGLPLDPMLSKTILASETYKCSAEILTILSMLSVNNSIFYRPKDKIVLADTIRKTFFSLDGDHLTLLNIYNQWKNTNYSIEWCSQNFIQIHSMNHARKIRNQLEYLMKHIGIEIHSNPTDSIGICKAICTGFFHHTAKFSGNEIYKTICHQKNVYIHPNSCLFGQMPCYVIYFELVLTTKEYMKQVIRIENEWLRETASYFYEINKLDDGK